MAKTKSNHNSGGAKQKAGNWTSTDHGSRTTKRIEALNKKLRRRKQEQEQADEAQELADAASATTNSRPAKRVKSDQQKPKPPEPHHELPIHQIRSIKKSHLKKNHTRLASAVPEDAYKRSFLAHDNFDAIDSTKSRLAMAQVQRHVNALKNRLENWDPLVENEKAKLIAEASQQLEDVNSIEYKMKLDAANRLLDRTARTQAQSEYNLIYAQHGVNSSSNRRKANLKSKPRLGPSSWKLRGAARPAWEVYDFDTRFVDVHVKAHEEENERARRAKNVVCECRGRFAVMDGDDDDENGGSNKNGKQQSFTPPQPHCREYLSLLTQLGSLQLHRKNYSSARKSFLEAIDLEGSHHSTSITNARYQLMNMYLTTNRPSSARKLWTLLSNDGSAWIKYSAALIEYVSWNLLQEDGSTAESAEQLLMQAIKGNVYVAFLLGWPQMFERAMEYTDEVVERGLDSRSGSILEAIEYGCCCYNEGEGDSADEEKGMGMWMGTEGSLDWVRSVVLKVLNERNNDEEEIGDGDELLKKADLLRWETQLTKEEEEFEEERNEREKLLLSGEGQDESEKEEEEEEPDVVMYAGMFRTAMDWLQDAGDFLKEPSYDFVNPAVEEEGADAVLEDKGDRNTNNGNDSDDSSDQGSCSGEEESGDIAQDQVVKDDEGDSSSSSNSTTNSSDLE
mmetsp:Transcript_3087/g.6786  ORF Transcript_3087/g.6786 Transcript_3087/m.6786 type:complete len:678 (-) Transcript_3087:123-2156(-)|eukprot:CAMPEP_0172307982 /NCGR_PEP_ID=MMETSP1058-20130122/8720_1 /TAXON_ID=83371 /ORGANISM="Detonula confervacea, Strain CCMP 353" /LENGTH=677 /DNA_ID=CAMNT_0013020305 /DNA_START=17 /DNA_END=2050 /DNA_ORIENTATION=+